MDAGRAKVYLPKRCVHSERLVKKVLMQVTQQGMYIYRTCRAWTCKVLLEHDAFFLDKLLLVIEIHTYPPRYWGLVGAS